MTPLPFTLCKPYKVLRGKKRNRMNSAYQPFIREKLGVRPSKRAGAQRSWSFVEVKRSVAHPGAPRPPPLWSGALQLPHPSLPPRAGPTKTRQGRCTWGNLAWLCLGQFPHLPLPGPRTVRRSPLSKNLVESQSSCPLNLKCVFDSFPQNDSAKENNFPFFKSKIYLQMCIVYTKLVFGKS